MEIEIYVDEIDKRRQNSFWYYGIGEIAKFVKNDRTILMSTCGSIRVKFLNEGFYKKNDQSVYTAMEMELFDDDLDSLDFNECNWFDYLYKNSKNVDYVDIEGDERFTYNEAFAAAIGYLDDDKLWDNF